MDGAEVVGDEGWRRKCWDCWDEMVVEGDGTRKREQTSMGRAKNDGEPTLASVASRGSSGG